MACSSARAPVSPSSQGPSTSQDWEKLRHVITELYVEENKTVDEVKCYMEEHHGFSAATTMYKKKLGAWGAFKNLRSSDVLQVLRLKKARDADQKPSVFLIRGKVVDAHNLQVYISRNPWLLAKAQAEGALHPKSAQGVTCYTPHVQPHPAASAAVPNRASGALGPPRRRAGELEIPKSFAVLLPSPAGRLQCPEIYTVPEDLFRALRDCLSRTLLPRGRTPLQGSGRGRRIRRRQSVLLDSVMDRIMTAALSVTRQVNPITVRHTLDTSFAVLIRVFRSPPPDLIPKLLTLATRLSRMGREDISRILLRFSRDLALVLRGPRDPLTRFWHGTMRVDDSQHLGTTERVFALALGEFEKHLGPSHDIPVSVYLCYFDIFERPKPPRAQLQSLRRQLATFDPDPPRRRLSSLSRALLGSLHLERQLATCKLELEAGRAHRAEAALLDLEAGLVNPKDEPFRLAWLGYVQWVAGRLPAAERSYRRGVERAMCCADGGGGCGSRDVVGEALFQLERFLLLTGQLLAAEAVRAQRFQVLQGGAGSILCVDADHDADEHSSRQNGSEDSPRGIGGCRSGVGPSVVKIYIASGATVAEKWRPAAFDELTKEPWALLRSGNLEGRENGAPFYTSERPTEASSL